MMKRKVVFVVALSVLLLGTICPAEVISTEFGNGADTYLTNDSQQGPDTNWGTESRMRACRQLADTRSKTGYIRFDISGVGDITAVSAGAFLTFDASYLKGSAKVVDVYGIIDGDDDLWIESGEGGVTYNTAAGLAAATLGNYAIDPAKAVLLGTITTPALPDPAVYPVLFSSLPSELDLEAFLNADTNGLVTFFFIGGNNEAEFATKEHSTYAPPALVLVPEPATMFLLGVGGLLTILRKRG